MLGVFLLGVLAQPSLAIDVDPARVLNQAAPSGFTELRPGVVIFSANSEFGRELWVTDGTPGGSQLLADLVPGPGSSFPYNFFRIGSKAGFFAAVPGHVGLWVTDGTTVGTTELAPGRVNQSVFPNGAFALVQFQSPPSAWDIFEWDGVTLTPWATLSAPIQNAYGTSTGMAARLTDGTSAFFFRGRPPVIVSSPGISAVYDVVEPTPGNPVELGVTWTSGAIPPVFTAISQTGSTSLGSWPIGTAPSLSRVGHLGPLALFKGQFGTSGNAIVGSDGASLSLWATLPANSVQTLGIAAGELLSVQVAAPVVSVSGTTPGANRTIAQANDWPDFLGFAQAVGSRAYLFNGVGVFYVADLDAGTLTRQSNPTTVRPTELVGTSNGVLLSLDRQLWSMTPDGVLSPLDHLWVQGASSSPRGLAHWGQQLLFSADVDGGTGLFAFPGPDGGALRFLDADVTAVSGAPPLITGQHVLYVGQTPTGPALFSVDPAAPTPQVVDPVPGTAPELVGRLGERVVYVAGHPDTGREVFITDGTAAGTSLLADVQAGPGNSSPSQFVSGGSQLYFVADDGLSGRELWRTDGTSANTARVADIRPGPLSAQVTSLVAFASGVAFGADDGVHGAEVWVSDAAGPRMIGDLLAGAAGSRPHDLVASGTHLYFAADDGAGEALFVFDGTTTTRVVARGPLANTPLFAAPIGRDGLLFINPDPTHGAELWLASPAGATLLVDLAPGAASLAISRFWAFGDRVFFAADDGRVGSELFVSDGTATGTMLLGNLAPGDMSATPAELTQVGRTLYFAATGPGLDRELYRFEVPALTDNTPPRVRATVSRPPDQDGWYRAPVDVRFEVADAESPVTATGCDPQTVTADTSGEVIVCTATSAGGSSAAQVTLKLDALAPVVTCPADVHLEATTPVPATYTASALDDVVGAVPVALEPPSGAVFPLGASVVVATASDSAGNVGTCVFTVTVALPAADVAPPAPAKGCAAAPGACGVLGLLALLRLRRRR